MTGPLSPALRKGLAYGWLSTRRRAGQLVLPVVTTATGAFLLVQVLTLTDSVRRQSAALGDTEQLVRATTLIAVVVLLVGVVEVAVSTTRTVVHRTREIGVLGATGVPRGPVVGALLVEPLVAAVAGAAIGGLVAVVGTGAANLAGLVSADVRPAPALAALALAVGTSAVAALVTSAGPAYRAASRPPALSLTSGG
ncbi:FtsX-like permease family protein [Kineosporia sp. R_H_3]|uniref:FtsX-like permease family protein n=1 Tax=Kineosporia sp. R_H_3 TaxID=1961848 RepID=UPI0018E9D7D9|nr:FtsX-like permease family protein [Kineosporia sp. R_H_3]